MKGLNVSQAQWHFNHFDIALFQCPDSKDVLLSKLNTSENYLGPKPILALKRIIIPVMRTTETEVRSALFPLWLREARTKCTFLWPHSHRSWSEVDQVRRGLVLTICNVRRHSFLSLLSNSQLYSHEVTSLMTWLSEADRWVSTAFHGAVLNWSSFGGPLLPPGCISWVSLRSFIHSQAARWKQTRTWRQHRADPTASNLFMRRSTLCSQH